VSQLKISPSTFIAWQENGAVIGKATDPTRRFQVDAGVIAMLARFQEPSEEEDFRSRFKSADARATADRILSFLKENGFLTTEQEETDDPSLLKFSGHEALEVARFIDVFPDLSYRKNEFSEFYDQCKGFSYTSMPMMYALYSAMKHVSDAGIDGDVVECGVWRGGSMMMAALSLKAAGDRSRTLHLYDTFDLSWEARSEKDHLVYRAPVPSGASSRFRVEGQGAKGVSQEEVLSNLLSTGFPRERIRLIRGLVQETLPKEAPRSIALLRLDTDFYESTYHELVCLFPLLKAGGVLIIDDYGKHQGATEAVDRYFAENRIQMLLNRIDVQGRMGIKA
jgi:hypothetical protein